MQAEGPTLWASVSEHLQTPCPVLGPLPQLIRHVVSEAPGPWEQGGAGLTGGRTPTTGPAWCWRTTTQSPTEQTQNPEREKLHMRWALTQQPLLPADKGGRLLSEVGEGKGQPRDHLREVPLPPCTRALERQSELLTPNGNTDKTLN